MRMIALASALGMLLAMCLQTTSAQAAPRTWVSNNRAGPNDPSCPRSNPCSDFQFAHDATDNGGEINCVDSGDYSPFGTFSLAALNISKSITIDCAALAGV